MPRRIVPFAGTPIYLLEQCLTSASNCGMLFDMTNSVRLQDPAMPALAVGSLRKSYPGDVVALDGLDLTVPTGSVFGLLGPNGAGKTTAVKILATLSRPDEGTAVVAGIDVLTDPAIVRRLVGYVSQRSGADAHATGTENLMLQARVHGIDRHEARRVSARLLDRFGLTEAADRVVKTWSGGMRRRLDIALAMVHSPKVLFLDEPTTGLDPEVRTDLWNEIRRLRDEDRVTVLLTTHYLEEADQLADRIAIVDHGKVVAEGTPSQLKDGMKGDALHIDVTESDLTNQAIRILDGEPGLRGLVAEGRTIHARAARGAEAVPRVITALNMAGIEVSAITVSRPSLDDVFLAHAGRRYATTEIEVPS
jgi:ABC-2 type transport system ATP-binding protein